VGAEPAEEFETALEGLEEAGIERAEREPEVGE